MKATSLGLVILAFVLTGFVLDNESISHPSHELNFQVTPTNASTVVSTPSPATTPTPNAQPTVSYQQMLEVEKSVLETTRSSLDLVVKVVTIALTVLTAGGIAGGIGLAVWYARAFDRVDKALTQVRDLEERSQKLNTETKANIEIAHQTKASFEQVQKDVADLKQDMLTWRFASKRDADDMRTSLLGSRVEQYASNLSADNAKVRWAARQGLIALTDSSRPIAIRRRCVEILGKYILTSKDPAVIKQLGKLTQQDAAEAVRQTAQYALDHMNKLPAGK